MPQTFFDTITRRCTMLCAFEDTDTPDPHTIKTFSEQAYDILGTKGESAETTDALVCYILWQWFSDRNQDMSARYKRMWQDMESFNKNQNLS